MIEPCVLPFETIPVLSEHVDVQIIGDWRRFTCRNSFPEKCGENRELISYFCAFWKKKISHALLTYTAFSLKEIGAKPGGTAKTFWLPV